MYKSNIFIMRTAFIFLFSLLIFTYLGGTQKVSAGNIQNVNGVLQIPSPCILESGFNLNETQTHHDSDGQSVDYNEDDCIGRGIYAPLDGVVTTSIINLPANMCPEWVTGVNRYPNGSFDDHAMKITGVDSSNNTIEVLLVHIDINAPTTIPHGTTVSQGQYLGEFAQIGCSDGPHVHLHIKKNSSSQPYSNWDLASNPEIGKYINLINPIKNEVLFSNGVSNVTFSWSQLLGYSGTYDLYVNNYHIGNTSSTSYAANLNSYNIPLEQNINWRVETNSNYTYAGRGIEVSPTKQFKISIPKPTFEANYPYTNSHYTEPRVNFVVTPLAGTYEHVQYGINVATDANFTNIVNTYGFLDYGITGNNRWFYAPSGGDYYVRAYYRADKNIYTDYVESIASDTVKISVSHPDIELTKFISTTAGEMLCEAKSTINLTSGGLPYYTYDTRCSNDGIFDNSASKESWASAGTDGASEISIAAFNNTLYETIRDKTSPNVIKVRTSTDGVTWSSWATSTNSVNVGTLTRAVKMFVFNNKLYQLVVNTSSEIFARYTADGVFDGETGEAFAYIGEGTGGDIETVVVHDQGTEKIVQSTRGGGTGGNPTTGTIWIRSFTESNPSQFPQSWTAAGSATGGDVEMVEFKGRLYQFIRGFDAEGSMYMRSTAINDLVFDESESREIWLEMAGQTLSDINSVVFNDRMYLVMRERTNTGTIRIMTSADGVFDGYNRSGLTESEQQEIARESWHALNGGTSTDIAMISINDKLYQVIGGSGGDNKLYIRSSSDGNFDGGSGEGWTYLDSSFQIQGQTIDLEEYNDRIYIAVIDSNGMARVGKINPITKQLENFSNSQSWDIFGGAEGKVDLFKFGNKLFQSQTSGGELWMRYTTDGDLTSHTGVEGFSSAGISLYQTANMFEFNDKLIQSVTRNNGSGNKSSFLRYSSDGVNWSTWYESGGSYREIQFAKVGTGSSAVLYQSVVGNNSGHVYARRGYLSSNSYTSSTPQEGIYWSDWLYLGGTYGSGRMISHNDQIYIFLPHTSGMWSNKVSDATSTTTTWTVGTSWLTDWWHEDELTTPGNITSVDFYGKLCVATQAQHNSTVMGNIWTKCKSDNEFDAFINEENLTDSMETWFQ